MKIVDPTDASHIILIIPRDYDYSTLVLQLYNEDSQVTSTVANTSSTLDGLLTVNFDYSFTEGQKFQIKITASGEVIYRGKLIATAQDPQSYKATNQLYYYE